MILIKCENDRCIRIVLDNCVMLFNTFRVASRDRSWKTILLFSYQHCEIVAFSIFEEVFLSVYTFLYKDYSKLGEERLSHEHKR